MKTTLIQLDFLCVLGVSAVYFQRSKPMPNNVTSSRKRWGLAAVITAILLISIFALAPAPADTAAATNVQPALLAMAAEQPDTAVRVIIQKSAVDADVTGLVTQMGGEVIHELKLINAVAAEMTVETAVDLTSHASVSWVSLDGLVESAGKPIRNPIPAEPQNYYLDTLGVPDVWDMGYVLEGNFLWNVGYDGTGIGVAVIDSGLTYDADFDRIGARISFSANSNTVNDVYGHGTHVAGIIAGSGADSSGAYKGIAPGVELFGLKISDETGLAYESDTVAALEWVFDNKDAHNIRVVNLSINSTTEQSYHDSPLNAAAEILWLNGVVVVASSGNRSDDWSWDTINTAPANDPLIITVGASHENGDADPSNDYMALFTANDITIDGFMKPDVIAPGKDIYSVLSSSSSWGDDYPDRCLRDCEYYRLSGTSMSAPMVTGAVALLLEAEPHLTPDQVKYRLMNTGGTIYGDFPGADFAYLNVYDLITTSTTESANQDVVPHMLLAKMALIAYWASENGDENIDWSTVDWDAVNWDAIDWDAVDWDSVDWGAVNWGSVNWGSVNWGSVNWGSVNWGSVNWGSVNWGSVNWGSVNWGSLSWDD
jgi:serine protease AprX